MAKTYYMNTSKCVMAEMLTKKHSIILMILLFSLQSVARTPLAFHQELTSNTTFFDFTVKEKETGSNLPRFVKIKKKPHISLTYLFNNKQIMTLGSKDVFLKNYILSNLHKDRENCFEKLGCIRAVIKQVSHGKFINNVFCFLQITILVISRENNTRLSLVFVKYGSFSVLDSGDYFLNWMTFVSKNSTKPDNLLPVYTEALNTKENSDKIIYIRAKNMQNGSQR